MSLVKKVYDTIGDAAMLGPTKVLIMRLETWNNLIYELTGLGDIDANSDLKCNYLNHDVILATNIELNKIIVR